MIALRNMIAFLVAAVLCVDVGVFAHPGEDIELVNHEAAIHKATLKVAHAAISRCDDAPAALALKKNAIFRRYGLADALQYENSLGRTDDFLDERDEKDLKKWEALSHDDTSKDWNAGTPESVIFGSNATTALTPESILGPYFVSGELFRKDITEGQDGVPLHLDLQFVNQNTYEPIPDMLVDIWHSNATGVYSGIAQGAGQAGLNTTFLRGVAKTDTEGVVQFDTIYPGHYGGRSNHIHILTIEGGIMLPNKTYTGGRANHVGQLYFNQALNDAVENFAPYNSNKQQYTTNQNDGFAKDAASAQYDPFMSYIRLGSGPGDGLLAYITVGVNQDANYDAKPAAHWGHDGGHECHNDNCN
ncbi:hypothetical protein PFICI_09114 [Pestalotiopsis fici W106-1]|uniref:Intradiol ring-cleavage dioxygenases domain-containing protein n=1 Tax=Pestalotiopsis fici (strain W106-1 / CGMCC3.15140) TaxID=1229662 RepID=W3X277_PESFW|nr:uncharacterized protein PFICI_09114 [Pestalotiopsis fici W106-1]ETS79261.1 hypothetical protein PFICI_09114 [Pestalotiopsis fici W106-1]